MAKLAVLVGICYLDTNGALKGCYNKKLKGCYNDVKTMQELLTSRYGFQPEDVQILTDEPGSALLPTGGNIKKHSIR